MPRSLTARTVFALGVLALFVGAMFALLLRGVSAQDVANDASRAGDARVEAAVSEQKLVVDLETGLRGYLIAGDNRFLEPYRIARGLIAGQGDRLVRLAAPRDRPATERLSAQVEAYVRDYAAPIAARPAPRSRAVRARLTAIGKRRMDVLRRRLSGYIAGQLAASRAASDHSSAGARLTTVLAIGGLVSSVLLVLLVAGYQLRFVLAPVRRVGGAARRMADGDLSVRVEERGSGEVSDLAESFNLMAGSLEYTRDELERQNAELEAQQFELERTVEDLAKERDRIERFQRYSSRLAGEVELEPLGAAIVKELGDLAGAEVGALYVFVEEAGEAGLVAVRGLDGDRLPIGLRPGEGLAGRALGEHRMITASYERTGLRLPGYGGEVAVTHELHVPLVQGERSVGVIMLGRMADLAFAPAELEALEQLAERAAIGVSAALSLRTTRNQAVLNRAVIDTTADAFVSLDENGVVVQWNGAAEKLFGVPAAAALGRRVADLLVPERFRASYERAIADFVAGGEWPLDGARELAVLDSAGREFTVEATISPLRLGPRVQFNAFIRDVTERKRHDLYREAHHRVTRGLSESASLEHARWHVLDGLGTALGFDFGATLASADGGERLELTSVWSSELDGYSHVDAAGQALAFTRGDAIATALWEGGEPVFVEDLSLEGPPESRPHAVAAGLRSGVAFPVIHGNEFMGGVMLFWHGRRERDPELLSVLGTLGAQIGQFIARKHAEAEADRLKDEFFALVSHELRTPLTSIIGYLELVLEDDGVDAQSRRFLEVVDRNAGRLLRLVGDLLFVAQVEAGKLSLDPGEVDLWAVCAESIEMARPRAAEGAVELVLDAERVPSFRGDAGRLGQAIDNLVSNAIKFTPDGGRVSLSLRRCGNELLIEVADTGIGIAPAEQDQLFDRFFRARRAHDQAIPGVGLGLTIVQAIVEGHGGAIALRSEEGRGTVFTVALPLPAGGAPGRSGGPAAGELADGAPVV